MVIVDTQLYWMNEMHLCECWLCNITEPLEAVLWTWVCSEPLRPAGGERESDRHLMSGVCFDLHNTFPWPQSNTSQTITHSFPVKHAASGAKIQLATLQASSKHRLHFQASDIISGLHLFEWGEVYSGTCAGTHWREFYTLTFPHGSDKNKWDRARFDKSVEIEILRLQYEIKIGIMVKKY